MSGVSKSFSLLLILMLALSSLIIFKPAFAQSISTPSVPTFTVQYVVYTSYIAPTYTINPYTGQNETTSSGGQVNNETVEFIIKNQPFSSYSDSSGNLISLYYNFRLKGHYGDEWAYYYPFFSYHTEWITTHSWENNTLQYYTPSSSDNSVIQIDLMLFTDTPLDNQPFPNGSQVDFQVQAKIGYITALSSNNLGVELGGNTYSFTGESSDWSNTQTLTINYNSNSTASNASRNPTLSSSPISTPTSTLTSTSSVPEFSALVIVPLLLSASLLQ